MGAVSKASSSVSDILFADCKKDLPAPLRSLPSPGWSGMLQVNRSNGHVSLLKIDRVAIAERSQGVQRTITYAMEGRDLDYPQQPFSLIGTQHTVNSPNCISASTFAFYPHKNPRFLTSELGISHIEPLSPDLFESHEAMAQALLNKIKENVTAIQNLAVVILQYLIPNKYNK